MTKREIFIETHRIGSAMKITAVDALTGVEVSFQAPAQTGRAAIEQLAAQKLVYVLKKKP